jgi:hypothetical protein
MGGIIMDHSCEEIDELLIPYINRNCSKEEIKKVVLHISTCKTCREEIAFLIQLKSDCKKNVRKAPEVMRAQVFSKINGDTKKESHTIYLSKQSLKTPYLAFEVLDYVMNPIKTSVNLLYKLNKGGI